MIRPILCVLTLFLVASCKAGPQSLSQPEPLRVLIIGDSISMGYTPHVRRALAGRALIVRPTHAHRTGDPAKKGAENCEGTNKGVEHLDRWLAIEGGQWDVIHFNFGLHDLKRVEPGTGKNSNDSAHPHQAEPEAYRSQLRSITERLQATGARIMFATTTPVPEGDLRPYREPNDSVQYNAIAKAIMEELNVPVNDLFAFVESYPEAILKPANVHFTKEGSQALGQQVAAEITSLAQ